MRRFLTILATVAALAAGAQTGVLPRVDAAAEGVDPKAVIEWVDSLMALNDTEIHHLMVVRHGKVVAEAHPAPFRAGDVHTLYSCSKTVTALAIGRLIDENRLRLDDRVAALLPEKMPDTISDKLSQITVRHLLTMSTGIMPTLDFSISSDDWVRHYYQSEVNELGRFRYDTMCTVTLAAIVQKFTGMTLLDYVKQTFFEPMGITVADWELSPMGVNTAGYGLRLQAESMAKIGLLILHRGNWNGSQLVSAEWIDQMTTKQINYKYPGDTPTDTNQGYCYQMWRCLLPDAVRADGAYGQFIIISPERDLVVVMNGMSERTRDELRLTWKSLIPGISDNTFKFNKKQQKRMCDHLAALQLPLVKGQASSDNDRLLRYRVVPLDSNLREYKSLQVSRVDDNTITLSITDRFGQRADYRLTHNRWSEPLNASVVPPYHNGAIAVTEREIRGLDRPFTVSGCYAWTTPDTLHCRMQWTNWITRQDIVITFDSNGTPRVTFAETPK